MNLEQHLASKLSLNIPQVNAVLRLSADGATIPFIARYRKDSTGNLDEVAIEKILRLSADLQELEKRRSFILKTIEDLGELTDDLRKGIESAMDLPTLEDIYLPFKPKRKTRAEKARERGLEGLAKILMAQNERDPNARAQNFLSEEVPTVEDALQGARDIIAEWINENPSIRQQLRQMFGRFAMIHSKVIKSKADEGVKYQDYFDFSEPLKRCQSHRFLAMMRGEAEGFLRVQISPDEEQVLERMEGRLVKGNGGSSDQVILAIKDAWKRLLQPSLETEFRQETKKQADEAAIHIFTENLRQLLLAPPLGEKRTLGIDPGFQSGCKLVCLDEHGSLLHNENIYPHPPKRQWEAAQRKIATLCEQYRIEAIAIGNGTASRETEDLVRKVRFRTPVQVFVVSEAGASVYSASSVAREEFPSYDVTVRGAVSIGRRLMDPLSELVKIEPKALGVGQYQHDVDQNALQASLDRVVESCVNRVGVNLNTASHHLLTHVSGLGPVLARNIVEYRGKIGGFEDRSQLKDVPRLGPKAFEQAAGFLRISDGKNPLDNSSVHPESYAIVRSMARDLGVGVEDLIGHPEIVDKIDPSKYSATVGTHTLQDILDELKRPNRDPRKMAKVFQFSDSVRKMEDLKPGLVLPGIVSNITHFGAFVDIGVKQDGLVHISQLKRGFVQDPLDVVRLHQQVEVKVLEVDIPRKRISLSMLLDDQ